MECGQRLTCMQTLQADTAHLSHIISAYGQMTGASHHTTSSWLLMWVEGAGNVAAPVAPNTRHQQQQHIVNMSHCTQHRASYLLPGDPGELCKDDFLLPDSPGDTNLDVVR